MTSEFPSQTYKFHIQLIDFASCSLHHHPRNPSDPTWIPPDPIGGSVLPPRDGTFTSPSLIVCMGKGTCPPCPVEHHGCVVFLIFKQMVSHQQGPAEFGRTGIRHGVVQKSDESAFVKYIMLISC